MPRCVTTLVIRTRDPLTGDHLKLFDGDGLVTDVKGELGGHGLSVTLAFDSYDPDTASTRAAGHVLERVPGRLMWLHSEVRE